MNIINVLTPVRRALLLETHYNYIQKPVVRSLIYLRNILGQVCSWVLTQNGQVC